MAEPPAAAPAGVVASERDALLATKLYVPGPVPGYVARPRLAGAPGEGPAPGRGGGGWRGAAAAGGAAGGGGGGAGPAAAAGAAAGRRAAGGVARRRAAVYRGGGGGAAAGSDRGRPAWPGGGGAGRPHRGVGGGSAAGRPVPARAGRSSRVRGGVQRQPPVRPGLPGRGGARPPAGGGARLPAADLGAGAAVGGAV